MSNAALKGIAMGVLFVATVYIEHRLGLSATELIWGLPLEAIFIFSIGYWSGIGIEKAF